LSGPGGDAALGLLLNLGDQAIELLRGACSDQDEAIRLRALGALVELDTRLAHDEVRESLFRALLAALGDRSARCRVFAATRLEALSNPKAARALASQLKDGDDTVRAACRQALLAIGEPSVPYLLDALGDRNINSRRLAAELLGEICGGKVTVDSQRVALLGLIDRASDGNAEIATAIHRALEMIPSDAVIATQLEWLADPERSDHEEIGEFLTRMLAHGALDPESKNRIVERMSALGFQLE
jgi:HEAT repeat protein